MAYSLLWLPEILLDAGLKVALVPGWEDRGHGDMADVFGVLCHHTATPATARGNYPTLDIIVKGRKDDHGRVELAGPLAQLGLGRDGTFYVIAAGKCYHAGAGIWKEVVNGNANLIGIEAENSGSFHDPWPEVQVDAYARGVAAILKHVGQPVDYCAGHKEYALPRGRKDDPSFDMVRFRSRVGMLLAPGAPPPPLIPRVEPAPAAGKAPRPTLRRTDNGAVNDLVKQVQQELGIDADGIFGPGTEAAVRAFQRQHGMVPDGIVGPKTWKALDEQQ